MIHILKFVMDVRLLLEASNGLQTGLVESFRLRGECYLQSSSQLVASASISVYLVSILVTAMLNVILSPKDDCLVNCDVKFSTSAFPGLYILLGMFSLYMK